MLCDLNARLKAGRHRCAVERRKASLVLRATPAALLQLVRDR
ncbi:MULTISPECIES: hypothetical protein [Synechococcales]|nr:hypothetical protein [Synechococcus sp. CS-1333]